MQDFTNDFRAINAADAADRVQYCVSLNGDLGSKVSKLVCHGLIQIQKAQKEIHAAFVASPKWMFFLDGKYKEGSTRSWPAVKTCNL